MEVAYTHSFRILARSVITFYPLILFRAGYADRGGEGGGGGGGVDERRTSANVLRTSRGEKDDRRARARVMKNYFAHYTRATR